MNNVVQLPATRLQSLLEVAKQSNELLPLLEAIKLTCEDALDVKHVCDAWQSGKNLFANAPFAEFAEFLTGFQFVLPKPESAPKQTEQRESAKLKSYRNQVREQIRQTAESNTVQHREAQQQLRATYCNFTPAYQLAHILPRYFRHEDPGAVIGGYMDLIFDRRQSDSIAKFSRYRSSSEALANTIVEIGKACLDDEVTLTHEVREKLRRALNYIILSRTDESGIDCVVDHGDFFATVAAAPDPLRQKMLWKWGEVDDKEQFHPDSTDNFAALLGLIGHDQSRFPQLSRPLPFLAVDLIYLRIGDALAGGAITNPAFVDALSELIARARKHSRCELSGRSAFSATTSEAIAFWGNIYIAWHKYDLRLALCEAANTQLPQALHVWDSTDPAYRAIDLRNRCDAYLELFDACVDEGFPHLASACLAFFIFSQAIAHKGDLGSWRKIASRLELAAKFAGFPMVEEALGVAATIASSSAPLTSLAIHRQSAVASGPPSASVIDISDAQAVARNGRDEIEADWKAYLGGHWDRLSTPCQMHLIDGDLKWNLTFRSFCKNLENWGGVGIDYAQAFEAELGSRLGWLSTSPLFGEYMESIGRKADKHLALGTLVKTLRDKQKLPPKLVDEIEASGVQCHHNGELMRQLWALVQLRNKAAHPNEFGPAQYTEMKGLVFRMLPAFADSLDPHK